MVEIAPARTSLRPIDFLRRHTNKYYFIEEAGRSVGRMFSELALTIETYEIRNLAYLLSFVVDIFTFTRSRLRFFDD